MSSDISKKELQQQKKQLRHELREKRRSLSAEQQLIAGQKLLETLISQPFYLPSQHITVYLARDGEIDPQPLVDDAWKKGKRVYLPVMDPQGQNTLTFLPWERDSIMITNSYGIPEPDHQIYKARPAEELDLVLLPLTGFDADGRRMGMGGGFYDRTFSFTGQEIKPEKPLLIGVAHECQRIDKIPTGHWDIPLSGIATDLKFYS